MCVLCRYLSSLILVEGIDIEFLHKCALENCTDQHQFSSAPEIIKVCRTLFYNLAPAVSWFLTMLYVQTK